MPFVELVPTKPRAADDTGVSVKITETWGLSVSLRHEALAVFSAPFKVKILFDADPVYPRLRVVAAASGPFELRQPSTALRKPSASVGRFVRVGRRDEFTPNPETSGKPSCTCERIADDGVTGTEIELPREYRRSQTVAQKVVNAKGEASHKQVSLAPAGR